MRPGDQYKMKIATLAILTVPGIHSTPDRVPLVVTAGSVVTIMNPEGTIVEVEWGGQRVSMFAVDVMQRGELLNCAAV
jgi:hypothetical protein